jgi:hypothetical protein
LWQITLGRVGHHHHVTTRTHCTIAPISRIALMSLMSLTSLIALMWRITRGERVWFSGSRGPPWELFFKAPLPVWFGDEA